MPAVLRARCIRRLRLDRFQGVPRWVRKTKSPGSLRRRISISRGTTARGSGGEGGFRVQRDDARLGNTLRTAGLVPGQHDDRVVAVDVFPLQLRGFPGPRPGEAEE